MASSKKSFAQLAYELKNPHNMQASIIYLIEDASARGRKWVDIHFDIPVEVLSDLRAFFRVERLPDNRFLVSWE